MNACQPLKEYSWFIDRVRKYTKEYRKKDEPEYVKKAVSTAIDDMPPDWILKQFLVEHRLEVSGMWESEFNEKELWDEIREALREEVIEEFLEEKIKLKDEKLEEIRIIDAEIIKLKDMLEKEKEKKRLEILLTRKDEEIAALRAQIEAAKQKQENCSENFTHKLKFSDDGNSST